MSSVDPAFTEADEILNKKLEENKASRNNVRTKMTKAILGHLSLVTEEAKALDPESATFQAGYTKALVKKQRLEFLYGKLGALDVSVRTDSDMAKSEKEFRFCLNHLDDDDEEFVEEETKQ